MVKLSNTEIRKLDDAARAGWLYYVGGKTHDEIASRFVVSFVRKFKNLNFKIPMMFELFCDLAHLSFPICMI